jgi:branched-chain amino acid transport system substrate-binding protein
MVHSKRLWNGIGKGWSVLVGVVVVSLLCGGCVGTPTPVATEAPPVEATAASSTPVAQSDKTLRIGVLYDYTGSFAAGGSMAAATGTEIAIEMVNEKGGVLGQYRVEAIIADAQSNADMAVVEAERLFDVEKVDALVGIYSSAHAVPIAAKLDPQKRFVWLGVPSSSAVLKDKNYQYVFRCLPHSDQFGELSPQFLAEVSEELLGIEPRDLRVAIIYEDGPYGTGVADGNVRGIIEHGLQLVLRENYSASSTDLSALIVKLRRAEPDVILHTGYNPDITLFLRQAREQALTFKALIGHGSGYAQPEFVEKFKTDIDYFLNVDTPAAQQFDPVVLAPGLGDLTQEYLQRYAEKTGVTEPPNQASSGFNFTWLFLNTVVPRALNTYGDWSADSLRKAAMDLDIADGGTVSGFGIKFASPGDPMAGQNIRAFPVMTQYVEGKAVVVYPTQISAAPATLPLPPGNPYADK